MDQNILFEKINFYKKTINSLEQSICSNNDSIAILKFCQSNLQKELDQYAKDIPKTTIKPPPSKNIFYIYIKDNIFQMMLSYLSLKEIIYMNRVCRNFKPIIQKYLAQNFKLYVSDEHLSIINETELKTAQQNLSMITKAQITEVKSFANPPTAIFDVLSSVAHLLNDVKNMDWKYLQKNVLNPEFLNKIMNFDIDSINEKNISNAQKILENKNYTNESIRNVSLACGGLYSWIIAIITIAKPRMEAKKMLKLKENLYKFIAN